MSDTAAAPARAAWRRHLPDLLGWVLPLATAWAFFATLRATGWARLRGLRSVENYGMAVVDQFAWVWANEGVWRQTVHFGYDDTWTWSGHRPMLWPLVAKAYAWDPQPFFLVQVQLGLAALACLPAYALGRAAIGGVSGGIVGLALLALSPPFWAIALNDYQDIVLGVPFLLAAWWAMRERRPAWFLLFAALAAAAREEWALMLPLLGLGLPARLRERATWVGWGLLVTALHALVGALAVEAGGYENPMATHMDGMLHGIPPLSRTWADWERFYQHFFLPVGWIGVFAPLAALPLLGLFAFHLTAPSAGGVDTDWLRHIHHMAPATAFLAVAGIEAIAATLRVAYPAGRSRWVAWWRDVEPMRELGRAPPRAPRAVRALLAVGLVALLVGNAVPWLGLLQLSPTVSTDLPSADAPEWALLAAHVPPDGVIATDAQASTLVSARAVAYTYDQSLQDKAPGRGLRAVEYLLVQKRHGEWVARAEAEDGATLLGETHAYRLYRFPRTPAQLVPGRVPGARPAGGAGDVAPGGAAGDANLRGRHRLGAP